MFQKGTMDPEMLRLLRQVAKKHGRKIGDADGRTIPYAIKLAAAEYSGGVKASLFRRLHFYYGYSASEIRHALKVRAPSHVNNALASADNRWLAMKRNRDETAIKAEIEKAEAADRKAAKAASRRQANARKS